MMSTSLNLSVVIMGESRRRKAELGDSYGKPEPVMKGIPISKDTAAKFVT
ncbi:MAG: DUF2839 domain-containing protein, partial [Cyanobacteria bacterium J06650_10]